MVNEKDTRTDIEKVTDIAKMTTDAEALQKREKFHIYLQQSELLRCLQIVGKALPNKFAEPPLFNVMISRELDWMEFLVTDLEFTLVTRCRATFPQGFDNQLIACVPYKTLYDLVRQMDYGEVKWTHDPVTQLAVFKYGKSQSQIKCGALSDAPTLGHKTPDVATGIPFGDEFTKLIDRASMCAGEDTYNRPILTGLNIRVRGRVVSMATADGFRLARATFHMASGWPAVDVTVPNKAMKELATVFRNTPVTMYVSERNVMFGSDNTTAILQRIQGTYPDLDQVIPEKYRITLTLDRVAFLNIIKRMHPFAEESYDVVHLTLNSNTMPDRMLVFAEASQVGRTEDVIMPAGDWVLPADTDLDLMFSDAYLKQGVSEVGTETFTLNINTVRSPIGIMPAGSPDIGYVYVSMPRVESNEPSKEEGTAKS